ncbi:unnamed protein product [Diplocarpon coronariae]
MSSTTDLLEIPPSPVHARERGAGEDGQQAGRTGSSLGADRYAADMRLRATEPPLPRDDVHESSRDSSSTNESDAASPDPNKRSSWAPVVSSPLNPSASYQSFGATVETSLPLPRPLASPASPWSTRPSTPRLISDLGQDYTRYPSTTSLLGTSRDSRIGSSHGSSVGSRAASREGARESGAAAGAAGAALLSSTMKSPFSESESDLHRWGFPDDRLGEDSPFFPGEKGFIMWPEEIEDDDRWHNPADDDEITFKPKLSDYSDRRTIVSTIGGICLLLGLLCVFIVLPVLTFSTNIFDGAKDERPDAWAYVNDVEYELLQNVRHGLIDPDTPASAKTRQSTFDDSILQLVFSDEFNQPNRTFYPGDDPYWTGPDFWYGATQDIAWYDPDAITTDGGTVQFRMDKFPNHGVEYRSGMLNSWNQLCFKGGVMEVSASLAGPAGVPGLWPGIWTMGNLGRPGYLATTEGVWPYTYDDCDAGITPNQSMSDGHSYLPGQKLNSCTCEGEDHPSPGKGRGAPEIDLIEGTVDYNNKIGVITQSYQIAPFDVWYRPNYDFTAIPNYNVTVPNTYCGGPRQQAVSCASLLNNDWYAGNAYQKYAIEYIPGASEGKIAWFVGDDPTFIMDGRAIGPNGNVKQRLVSEEPLSIILNLGISNSWVWIDHDNLKFPTTMHIDYVRIYQKKGQESVTCDPEGFETTEYIAKHPKAYNNPNMTTWDATGYKWPNHELHGC